MKRHRNCSSCRPGAYCEACKLSTRRAQTERRIRAGQIRLAECYRCMSTHPVGERYCRLAPEWNGYPWRDVDDGWTYPEAP